MKFMTALRLVTGASVIATGAACSQINDFLEQQPEKPDTPEKAISALPESLQASYNAWSAALEKSCDVSSVLGEGSSAASLAIDVDRLRTATKGTMSVATKDRFVLFGAPEAQLGTATSKREVTQTLNGQTRKIELETKREGQTCKVYAFGILVNETRLAQTIPIAASWDTNTSPATSSPTRVVLDPSSSPVGQMSGDGLVEAIKMGLRPKMDDSSFVASQLGLPADRSARYFTGSRDLLLEHVFQVLSPSSVLHFNSDDTRLLGSRASLLSISTSLAPISVRVRLKQPLWFTDHPDRGTWMVEVSVAPTVASGDTRTYQMKSAQQQGVLPFDGPTSAACFRDRLNVLRALETANDYELKPSLRSVERPCSALIGDLRSALLNDEGARGDVARLFVDAKTTRAFSYGGWNEFLRTWVQMALAQPNLDPMAHLDPRGLSRVVRAAVGTARTVRDRAASFTNLKALDAVGGLGTNWALRGEEVSMSQLDYMLRALDSAADVLPDAVRSLASQLDTDPLAWNEALKYANDLTPGDKDFLRRIQTLSTALDLTKWAKSRVETLLVLRPSRETIASWVAALTAAKEFSDRDSARVAGGDLPSHHERKQRLIERAVDEGWTSETFAATEAVSQLSSLIAACSRFTDASQLADCYGSETYSNRVGRLFDGAYAGRYQRLATGLSPRLAKVRAQNDTLLHDSVVREFFVPIWSRCDSLMFSAREQQLLLKLDERISDPDSFRRQQKDTEIRMLISAGC